MGARPNAIPGLDAQGSLADDLRARAVRVGAGPRGDAPLGAAYGACRLWDQVEKHNAIAWGRARAAVEAADAASAGDGGGSGANAREKEAEDENGRRDADSARGAAARTSEGERRAFEAFEAYYRAAMIEAYGDDIEALRGSSNGERGSRDDRADVGVIVRAIESGADVVPPLQRALASRFAALEEAGQLATRGDEEESEDKDSDAGEESDDVDEDDETEGESDGGPERRGPKNEHSSSSSSSSSSAEEARAEEARAEESEESSSSSERDDAVDYEITPVQR
jgi:hypothetical protein